MVGDDYSEYAFDLFRYCPTAIAKNDTSGNASDYSTASANNGYVESIDKTGLLSETEYYDTIRKYYTNDKVGVFWILYLNGE